MKKTATLFLSMSLVVLASVVSAFGQEKERPLTFEREAPAATEFKLMTQTPAGNNVNFMSSEFSFEKFVKGAPYSAQAVTETTQTLSDGNRIVNNSSTAVYRDSEGRTRREQTLKAIGPFASGDEVFKSISINDPVAGVAYVLEPHSRAARKIQAFHLEATPQTGYSVTAPGKEGEAFTFKVATGGEVQFRRAAEEGKIQEAKERTGFRKEELGTQTIEGVSAVGTRTTMTIPAGQIGNERAIDIVDERWFSSDLQTMVMTRHSDPRSGEVVYRLTNINRTEPDHSLFEVPADYTLREEQSLPRTTRRPVPEQ